MKKLNTILLATLLSSSVAIANGTFAGISLGHSHLNMDQNNDSIILGNEIEKNGYNLHLEAGYNYSDNIDIIANYQRVVHDDTYLNNFFISSNYKLNKIKKFTPYLGASIGYSELHWDKKPINTTDNDYVSGSYLLGATVGAIYPLDEKLSLNINYQLQYTKHDTNLESNNNGNIATSKLTHDFHQSVNIGIRYKF